MQRFNKVIYLTALTIGLVSCATSPENDPAYISPIHYSNYNCNQISAEMQRVSAKMDQAKQADTTGKVLDTAFAAFAVSQGYGYTSEDDTQYKRLVNQYDVLEQTAIQKECH